MIMLLLIQCSGPLCKYLFLLFYIYSVFLYKNIIYNNVEAEFAKF